MHQTKDKTERAERNIFSARDPDAKLTAFMKWRKKLLNNYNKK